MASNVGTLNVKLVANTGKFTAGMKTAGKSVKGFRSSVAGAMGGISKFGLLLTGGGILVGMNKMLNLAQDQIDAEKKLEAVLRATGGAAGYTSGELQKMAADLQKVTNYGDEVTLNAMAMMATFRNIKGDVFKESIKSVQDMATVMDQDLRSTVVQVGKALNDPIKGLTALGRVGVSFTEQQKSQIKAMQKSGDIMGAQKVILAELKGEFGGAAEAMVNPMTQLKNTMGDLGETIGKSVLPYLKLFASDMTNYLSKSMDDAKGKADGLNDSVGKIADVISIMVNGFRAGFAALQGGLAVAFLGFAQFYKLLSRVPGVGSQFKGIAQTAQEMADAMLESANTKWAAVKFDLPSERVAELNKKLANTPDAAKGAGDAINKAALDAVESIDKLTDKWQDQVDFFGQKGRTLEINKLIDQSGDPFSTGKLEELDKMLTDLETHEGLKKAGEAFAKSIETPLEKLRQAKEDLDKWRDVGAISDEIHRRGMEAAKATYMQALPRAEIPEAAGAMEMGSAAAYSTIVKNLMGMSDPRTRLQEQANDILKQVERNTRPEPESETVTIGQ